ncbi:MAG: hypothetical protein HZA54_08940, partial [Planctomycetes bacterium]|nr:hypothetical protein [Planctomycetota bacterium]
PTAGGGGEPRADGTVAPEGAAAAEGAGSAERTPGPRIARISWTHGGSIPRAELLSGLIVHFDGEVRTACLREETFQLLVRRSNPKTGEYSYFAIPSPPVMVRPAADARSAALVIQDSAYFREFIKPGDRLMVRLEGSAVLDRHNLPIVAGAIFLPNPDGTFALEPGEPGAGGGVFSSWFSLT